LATGGFDLVVEGDPIDLGRAGGMLGSRGAKDAFNLFPEVALMRIEKDQREWAARRTRRSTVGRFFAHNGSSPPFHVALAMASSGGGVRR
jgi:hypothetical protein